MLLFCCVFGVGRAFGDATNQSLVYIGTYTNFELLSPPHRVPDGPHSKGMYVCRFDATSGILSAPIVAAESVNPTFIAFHPTRPLLYAANEIYQFNGQPAGAVSAFSINPADGKLTLLNQVSSLGGGACYVKVDASGRNVLVANFGAGSVAVLPIAPDGKLKTASAFVQEEGKGPSPRQLGPHAHSFNPTPDGRLAVAADFGADKLFVYRFDPAAGTLTPHDPPFVAIKPGSAPRHLAFSPDGKTAYLLNEITSTVTVLSYDSNKGRFQEQQTISTLPADYTGANTAAEIQVHPSGKFIFASNRGHNSIAVLSVDVQGRLSDLHNYSVLGRTPRNFSLDPPGHWLIVANQDTNNVVVFAVDQQTGELKPNGQSVTIPAPLCVRFWSAPAVQSPASH
jgi:6-phosphogluconolactonase